jgi:hypothetical protein
MTPVHAVARNNREEGTITPRRRSSYKFDGAVSILHQSISDQPIGVSDAGAAREREESVAFLTVGYGPLKKEKGEDQLPADLRPQILRRVRLPRNTRLLDEIKTSSLTSSQMLSPVRRALAPRRTGEYGDFVLRPIRNATLKWIGGSTWFTQGPIHQRASRSSSRKSICLVESYNARLMLREGSSDGDHSCSLI